MPHYSVLCTDGKMFFDAEVCVVTFCFPFVIIYRVYDNYLYLLYMIILCEAQKTWKIAKFCSGACEGQKKFYLPVKCFFFQYLFCFFCEFFLTVSNNSKNKIVN